MSLSTAQLSTLATYIAAQGDLNTKPAGSDGAFAVAALLNQPDASNTIVYSPAIPSQILINAIVPGDLSALSAGQLAYLQMLLGVPTVDGTNATVGAAISSMFAGKQTLTNFVALARKATRFELLFTTSNVVTPPLYGYQVSTTDIQSARGN